VNNGIFVQDVYGRIGFDSGLPRSIVDAPSVASMPYHYPGGDWNVDLINNFVYVVDTRHSSTSDAVCRTHGGDANFPANINWGDGTIERRIDVRPRRRYNNHGIYTIQIIGVPGYFAEFGVGTTGDGIDSFRQNLIKCLSYGRFISNLRTAFAGCRNLTEAPKIMRSNIIRVYGMFSNCINFDQDLSLYDFSGLVDDGIGFGLQDMFNGCTKFNNGGSSDIGKWNTSAVTNLSNTFNSCRNFNQNIESWNISNVTNCVSTFQNCTSFNQPLNNWNVRKVTNFTSMFQNATSFNGSLSGWAPGADTAGANCSSMFQGATNFTGIGLDSWNTSGVTNMSSMFQSATSFNQPLNNWNVRKVTTFANIFNGATSFNGSLSGWAPGADTAGASCSSMFSNCDSFVGIGLNTWDVSKVNNMSSMFNAANSRITANSNFQTDISSWNLAGLNASTALVSFMANKVGSFAYSTANYDALLIGWNNNKLIGANGVANWRTDLTPSFGGAKYTAGGAAATARAALVSYGWTITDGGVA
jgi:surface protein